MIIVHENLSYEAEEAKGILKEVYNLESTIENKNLKDAFEFLPKFNAYFPPDKETLNRLVPKSQKKAVLIITPRDLYDRDRPISVNRAIKEDDWVFGWYLNGLAVVSTARLKGLDSTPLSEIVAPPDLYHRRLQALSVHEIGHGVVVHAKHFLYASWVNLDAEDEPQQLGSHCTDNTCIMYEIVDIKAPPLSEGYLLLRGGERNEKRYDAGLDDLLERMRDDWFCPDCRAAIKIDDKYR